MAGGNLQPQSALVAHFRCKRLGFKTGDLARVNTEIGYFVARVWAPKACAREWLPVPTISDAGGEARIRGQPLGDEPCGHPGTGFRKMEDECHLRHPTCGGRRQRPETHFLAGWRGASEHHPRSPPDPISGMHCWHQKVRIEKAQSGDQYGDVFVDTSKSTEVYRRWLEKTRLHRAPKGCVDLFG